MTKGWLNDDFDVPGDITAGGIENTPIGDTTASTIKGTTGEFSSNVQIDGNILDSNGNEILGLETTASAVNYVNFVNSTTLNALNVEAAGTDTNIDLKLSSKGTGKARLFTNGSVGLNVAGDGIVTKPLQSAFMASRSSSDVNVTGDGTVYTILFNIEIEDRQGEYNTGTGTFTASVTGLYHLCSQTRVVGINSAHTAGNYKLNTSNRLYQRNNDPGGLRDSAGAATMGISQICDMDAADTATISFSASNDTKTVDVQGSTDGRTNFSGWLLG